MRTAVLFTILAATACGRSADRAPIPHNESELAGNRDSVSDTHAEARPPWRGAEAAAPSIIARTLTLAEWGKAENRSSCSPIGLTDVGGADADVRRAQFSGGWAIAFDQPGARSQYGVAGTGSPIGPFEVERDKLYGQWPYRRELNGLKVGAIAAYGVEGAAPYPATDPDGAAMNSLAYVIVPGERCLYNVWSKLGRKHLETLLDGLVIIPAN